MKLPGVATLTFEIEPGDVAGASRLVQTARFKPRGLFGLLYWYAVLPFHGIVFRRTLRRLAEQSENRTAAGTGNDRPPGEGGMI